jgi:hypothetical protein
MGNKKEKKIHLQTPREEVETEKGKNNRKMRLRRERLSL